MTYFEGAFAQVIGVEGSLSLDPNDRGNWTSGEVGVGELRGTKYGISAMSFPDVNIANLSPDGARLIYETHYWGPIKADAMPYPVALVLFDAAVNQGIAAAGVMLQAAVGAEQDGVIGPATIAAVAGLAVRDVVLRLAARRIVRYSDASTWETYRNGWMARLLTIVAAALESVTAAAGPRGVASAG